FLTHCSRALRPNSLPTRRSSDLDDALRISPPPRATRDGVSVPFGDAATEPAALLGISLEECTYQLHHFNGRCGCFLALVAMAASDRKSTRLNSSHVKISYAVSCL